MIGKRVVCDFTNDGVITEELQNLETHLNRTTDFKGSLARISRIIALGIDLVDAEDCSMVSITNLDFVFLCLGLWQDLDVKFILCLCS